MRPTLIAFAVLLSSACASPASVAPEDPPDPMAAPDAGTPLPPPVSRVAFAASWFEGGETIAAAIDRFASPPRCVVVGESIAFELDACGADPDSCVHVSSVDGAVTFTRPDDPVHAMAADVATFTPGATPGSWRVVFARESACSGLFAADGSIDLEGCTP